MSKKITPNNALNKLGKLPTPENMTDSDKKFYSSIGSALLVNELEQLIQNKQWILGTIILGSMIDFVGKTKLIWHHKGRVSSSRIMKYKSVKTNEELLNSNIIDDSTYNKLEEIRKIRNSFAHDLLRQWATSLNPNIRYENLIREGIRIITAIFN